VAENIFLGHEPQTRFGLLKTRQLYADAEALLGRVGIKLDLRLPVGELTIAQQQMVEIAKALSFNSDLIVMDEPSAILAGHELDQLFEIIQSLIRQGVTVIYISHRLEEVFRIAQEITVLKDGQVVGTHPIEELSRSRLVQMMVGRSLDEVFPRTRHEHGEPILIAKNIASDTLLSDASFQLHQGEILGVAGMVGSGRTELARALFGVDRLTAGEIIVKGEAVRFRSPDHAIQQGLALVPEDRKSQGLFTALPIRNNITLTVLRRISRYGILQQQQENEIVSQAQQQLSIVMASPNQEAQYLSGGNQQKVVLAKWLATNPDIIILDEPTRGVDVGAKFEIYQLMRQLNDQGVAILMISSELTEILGMSDRILVMNDGQIVGEFSRDEATEEKIIELATAGTV
jgi:ribose transport system ATP-binding protein